MQLNKLVFLGLFVALPTPAVEPKALPKIAQSATFSQGAKVITKPTLSFSNEITTPQLEFNGFVFPKEITTGQLEFNGFVFPKEIVTGPLEFNGQVSRFSLPASQSVNQPISGASAINQIPSSQAIHKRTSKPLLNPLDQ
jgi:hypothetical protein